MSIDKLAGRTTAGHHFTIIIINIITTLKSIMLSIITTPIACQAAFDETAPTSNQVSATGSQASTWMIDIIQFCIDIIHSVAIFIGVKQK